MPSRERGFQVKQEERQHEVVERRLNEEPAETIVQGLER